MSEQKNNTRRPIYLSDLDKKENGDKIPPTNDKLTKNEMRKVKEFKNRDHVGIKTTKK